MIERLHFTTPACLKITTVAISAFALFLGITLGQDELRIWKDDRGREVKATFEGMDGGNVNLGLESGQIVPFPVSKLSNPDREWLKKAIAEAATKPKPTAPTPMGGPPEVAKKTYKADTFKVTEDMDLILDSYCFTCHEEGTEKGGVRLDNLADLSIENRLDMLNRMQEQIYIGEMPPKKKDQPTEDERELLAAWISKDLRYHGSSKLEEKLKTPEYGNYVNHEKLFSGEYKDAKAFTYDRRWLISEFIFDAKFNVLLRHEGQRDIDRKREKVIGDNNRRGINLTNPFLLPTNTGVRYYSNTSLDGGHLLTMIGNAKVSADHMIYLANRDARYLPNFKAIMAKEDKHNAILTTREQFLTNFIDQVLVDIYKDKHSGLLPTFVTTNSKGSDDTSGAKVKMSAFHSAQPGNEELLVIFNSMRNLEKKGDTDAQVIEKCEREWFYAGHNERTINTRVIFMNNYMDDLRKHFIQHKYAERNKPLVYKPLANEEMEIIHDAILKHRKKGDQYSVIIEKCMTEWRAEFKKERDESAPVSDEMLAGLVDELFVKILERAPDETEASKYLTLVKFYIDSVGTLEATNRIIQTLLLRSDFAYRSEFGQGDADQFGRKMLSPRDASYAISYALTDSSPDAELVEAANNGKLNTREDYKREVERLLAKRDQYYIIEEAVESIGLVANITNLPIRKLRFFREFFGYPKMMPIFKDNKRFGGDYTGTTGRLVTEADRTVEYILKNDKNVFEELLSTDEFYVYHSGNNEDMKEAAELAREIYDYFKDKNWEKFTNDDLIKHLDFLTKVKIKGINVSNGFKDEGRQNSLRTLQMTMKNFTERFSSGQKYSAPYDAIGGHGETMAKTRSGFQMRGQEVAKFFNIDLRKWDYPTTQPAKVAHRKGMLTHPAWIIAHSQNTETDPVISGKWVWEKLLAGTVPDVPITVDAVIPEDHQKTLRDRLVGVTEKPACWGCHVRMNPLGYTFEIYDDFGRFRTEESLEHPDNLLETRPDKGPVEDDLRNVYKTLPVDPKGYLKGSGDPKLDGPVKDAIDLSERLSKSPKARQSIIRYAFRYFMGRNEYLTDSKTLIDAEQAYLQNDGSFDAVIVSLLTSDSFIYRKETEN